MNCRSRQGLHRARERASRASAVGKTGEVRGGVILAGYESEMDAFFDSNPGFKSRVPLSFHFDDYTCAELQDIGMLQIKSKNDAFVVGPSPPDSANPLLWSEALTSQGWNV